MNITFPVEFPTLDLSTLLPIIALVVLAALILITLTFRSLISSRVLAWAIGAVVIVYGASTIVGGLQSLAILIGVAGVAVIGIIIALRRSPEVTELLHVVVRRDSPTGIIDQRRAELPAQPSLYLPVPPSLHPSVPSSSRPAVSPSRRPVIRLSKDSGF
jgi:hypothetical protein